ncbi:hypothetical protein [Holdemania sp. Marseille-P2844]|jgi:hypothetical protein|uniref:hypothetical protein n=1 Tax=Holdemania sp. Marseille-P2844 TaxID=1852366 RepID=UPI000933CE3B|nr:hypothetical protein [Holdemania sp. Marseille-P2844]
MEFNKPTIHMELDGCKVKGYMTGQKLDLFIMMAAVADFARQELTEDEIINAVSSGLAKAHDEKCRTCECSDDESFKNLAEVLIKEVFGNDKS